MDDKISNMNFQEIIDRLQAEGIKFKDFVRHWHCRPEWVGEVKFAEDRQNPRTKDEWKNHSAVLHLPAHGLYMRAHGVKDGGKPGNRKWRYELSLVECQTEEVPARAAFTKVTFVTVYPYQGSGYPDPTVK